MRGEHRCRLAHRDWAALRTLLERCPATDGRLAQRLRSKLVAADVIDGADIAPDMVTLDSRVAFTVDGGSVQTRVLVRAGTPESPGLTLPVTQPRALALLGLRTGESAPVHRDDGVEEIVRVEDVPFQPPAARWSALSRAAPGRAALRLVHSAAAPRPQLPFSSADGNDDPGPSAA